MLIWWTTSFYNLQCQCPLQLCLSTFAHLVVHLAPCTSKHYKLHCPPSDATPPPAPLCWATPPPSMQTWLHLADHNCCTDHNKMECTAVKWEASQRSGGVSRSPSPRASCCCGTTPDTMPCCTMSLLNLLFHTLPCHCILVLVAAVPHHTKYQPMRFSAAQISSHYMGWPGGIPKSGVSEFSRGFGRQQLGTWCEHLGILPHLLLHNWY